ncbi:MAG: cyclic nucleotide-binding domain-containing protein [Verrucomicrobiales bacterium]
MDPSDLVKLLSRNESFLHVPESALTELIAAGRIVNLNPADDLIQQGKSGQSVWLLVDGKLEVLVDGDLVNRIENAGEVVGEIGAVSLTPATATVRSSGPVVALEVTHQNLHRVMEGSVDLATSMLRSMAKYLGRR